MQIESRRREPRTRRLSVVIAAIVAALALIAPGSALASHSQEMILQDDQSLVYASPSQVADTLNKIKAMGVDRVRVSVVWSLVAPKSTASRKPRFDATNPAAYPAGAWYRYDFIDLVAHQIGLGVYFQPTAPAPTWATTPVVRNQGFRFANNINGKLYGQFVQAVGRRYDGHYPGPTLDGKVAPLPRIDYWGIYNEPNIGGWSTPQWTRVHGRFVPNAAAIYRRMVDAGWRGLVNTGHRRDTILVGETAAYGASGKGYGNSIDPLTFLRALYCVGGSYQPLRGASATAIGCPASGSRAGFAAAHPALFDATGWAHHPYDFTKPPSFRRSDPNSATLSGISRLETALNRVFATYGSHEKIPLYITEWGVQSRDPSPYVAFSQAEQAEFINEGEYMAWRDPRIRSFSQFLLTDAGPNTKYPAGSKPYWATFQSGLLLYPFGNPKPAYFAFELPIWLPHAVHGKHVTVWAQIRPYPHTGTIQFQPTGSSGWFDLAHLAPTDPDGYATASVLIPAAGSVRLRWDNGGAPVYGRTATVN